MFYLIEVCFGDDNDQSIGDFIVEADNKTECGKIIERCFWESFERDEEDVTADGDEDHIYFMWDVFYDRNGNEINRDDLPENFDDVPYTPFHEDYRITAEYQTFDEAEKNVANYHSRWTDVLRTNERPI